MKTLFTRAVHRYVSRLSILCCVALAASGCASTSKLPSSTVPATNVPAARPATTRLAADRFEAAIQKFELDDRENPRPPGGVMFYGSSSIVGWRSLKTDFPNLPTVNRGFGGSTLDECVRYFDRVVTPSRPAVLVVYAGENDLAVGDRAGDVITDFRALLAKCETQLPTTKLVYIGLKPSPSRWHLREAMMRTNDQIRAIVANKPRVVFIDVFTPMLDANGQPRAELFKSDRLHMTKPGYDLWTTLVSPALASR